MSAPIVTAEQAYRAGYEAAKNGLPKENPYSAGNKVVQYLNGFLRKNWGSGYEMCKPCSTMKITDVFASAFGGQLCSTDNLFDGEWVKKENYVGSVNTVFNSHLIDDGIYDVTTTPYLLIENFRTLPTAGSPKRITSAGLDFCDTHGMDKIYAWMGRSSNVFLFAGKPTMMSSNCVSGSIIESAFVVNDCPKKILVAYGE